MAGYAQRQAEHEPPPPPPKSKPEPKRPRRRRTASVQVVGPTAGADHWFPPGCWDDPPPNRRKWNAAHANPRFSLAPPWTRTFVECMEHPGRWALLAVTTRPSGIAHRVRTGVYEACQGGVWEATQRSVGNGYHKVWVKYVGPKN